MNTKHTSGPWFVGAQNDSLYVLDGPPSPAPYDGPIPRDYGPSVVATPNWRLPSYEANAHLIAAAPDLLAALKSWRNPDIGDVEANRLTAEAIAKAEGRS